MKKSPSKRLNVRRTIAQRHGVARDPWLILNMHVFNFAGGWSQLVAKQQTQHSNK